MLGRFLSLPLIVILMGMTAVSMYIPAAHAAVVGNLEAMRAFFESANIFLVLTAMVAIATGQRRIVSPDRAYLLAMLAAFLGLPLMMAVPFAISVPDTSFLNAYVEMVSDFTTTGATLFPEPGRLSDTVHLWRALAGWMGGLLILVLAAAVLAPMNLGGFEVLSGHGGGFAKPGTSAGPNVPPDGSHRLRRAAGWIFPVYLALTVVLWVLLLMLGDRPLVALSHAMSVLSTSGISPVGGLAGGASGTAGEAIIFVMLLPAITRRFTSFGPRGIGALHLKNDPEFRLGMFIVITASSLLFIRHWIGAFQVDATGEPLAGLRAMWGGLFTVLSFLTTTGFESADWNSARNWSGLAAPGIILMGLAAVGGGVATTAGGVKLLRVFALYKHGMREMGRLVNPSSVGGAGPLARQFRQQGARVAWVFFMLFAISLAVTVVVFTLDGILFEQAFTMAVAGLSTTGPLLSAGGAQAPDLAQLSVFSKLFFAAVMVLGRLETLAFIALFNPEFWRR